MTGREMCKTQYEKLLKKYFRNYFKKEFEVHSKIMLGFHRDVCVNCSVNLPDITSIV